jgi:hypothetical protein
MRLRGATQRRNWTGWPAVFAWERLMDDELFAPWFNETAPAGAGNVVVLTERDRGREFVRGLLVRIVADHLVDLEVVERMGGFDRAAHVLRNRLPTGKKARSGDFGEVLATEYVDRCTAYSVPVRRLRYKDDRQSAMRGDDVVGVIQGPGRVRVLKVEAKSRARLSNSVVELARSGLAKHRGRPNPSTLAFIEYVLRKEDQDDVAELFSRLQTTAVRDNQLEHLVFTVSGNDPSAYLGQNTAPVRRGVSYRLVGCRVQRHGDLVASVFDACAQLGPGDAVNR